MFGLEPVGPGRDVRVEGAGVPEFETPLGAPAAELAAQAWRGQVDEPRDDKLAELRTWVDGLPAKLRDSFLGEAVAGFEEVSNGIRDGLLQGFADAIRDAENLGARLIPIRDAARALIRPVEDKVIEVHDVLSERVDLLDGVRGYCAGYQNKNVNVADLQGNIAPIQFSPIGPSKGAEIRNGYVYLNEPGLWTVHLQVHARATSFTPGFGQEDLTSVYVLADGHPYRGHTIRETLGVGGRGRHTITTSFPFLVETPGTFIRVRVWSSRWRYFDGGTKYSSISVVKEDSRVENPGEVTVPDA